MAVITAGAGLPIEAGDSSQGVGLDNSGKGGVYKSLIDSVNKQDALCFGHKLTPIARYFPCLDGYPA
jgi:hypothetical protein